MKYSWFILFGMLFVNCTESVPRRPINKIVSKKDNSSIVLNKHIKSVQEKRIENYIQKDSLLAYEYSPYGFVFSKVKSSEKKTKTVENSSQVTYAKTVFSLDNKLIYEKSIETVVIGKSNEIKGVLDGLKLMREDEEFKFIFTSFVAHGFYGDRKKIGANTPIIVNIKLLKIN